MDPRAPAESPAAQPASLRDLPSVDAMLRHPSIAPLLDDQPRGEVTAAVRETLDAARAALREGGDHNVAIPWLAIEVRARLRRRSLPNLRRVINATGVILHTGLGRAPLADEALLAIEESAAGYCNLELDLETGERGDRHAHVRELLCELTGATDAMVVNNNAAATMLTLAALTSSRDVLISRGQLVEIGGSYRMPEIMAAAGCRMVEVGTTNRTHLRDYTAALSPQTAALLHVHTSNYRIRGFTSSVSVAELAGLARKRRGDGDTLWVIDDLGSGLLLDEAPRAEPYDSTGAAPAPADTLDGVSDADALVAEGWDEPGVRESVRSGADVTLFSGDKLLGGPQAGVILANPALIERIRAHPLARAVRPDKLTLAALEATLRLYRDPARAVQRIPVLRMLATRAEVLREMAERLAAQLCEVLPGWPCAAAAGHSSIGGGALPTAKLPTWLVRVSVPDGRASALAAVLRRGELPLIVRLHGEALLLDCRTISEADVELIPTALVEAARELLED